MMKEVSSKVDFIAQEHEILDFWEKEQTFSAKLEKIDESMKRLSEIME